MSLFDEVKQAKTLNQQAILSKPNVVGVGVGFRTSGKQASAELSLVVLVRQKLPLAGLDPDQVVPKDFQGIRTDLIEVGDLHALSARTDRWRPAPGGISIGHYMVSAGTFGGVVWDPTTGERLLLSNNHVLANRNQAQKGDPILQPGAADGGTLEKDILARLERFYPIRFTQAPATCSIAQCYAKMGNFLARLMGSHHRLQAFQAEPGALNLVDAALARPVENSAVLDEILELGEISGVEQAQLGMPVRKSGRSTALTSGEIIVVEATVTIGYGSGLSAVFEQQIVTSPMSTNGDSGALLVKPSASNHAVGLLFGGSEKASIFNPIQPVLDLLQVTFNHPAAHSKNFPLTPSAKVQQIRQNYQDWLMSKANVVGVGVGIRHEQGKPTGEPVLVVMVSQKVPKEQLDAQDLIPSEIAGVAVEIKDVGTISKSG